MLSKLAPILVLLLHAAAFGGALVLRAGRPVAFLYPLASVAIALPLLRRRSSEYLEFVLWLWLLMPAVRRVVDLDVGWTPVSPVMTAAPLASMLCLGPALVGKRPVYSDATRVFAVLLSAIAFAFAVGSLTNGVPQAAGSLLEWVPSASIGLYVASSGPATPELRAMLIRFALWGAAALGAYGIIQFTVMPSWDSYWMRNAPLSTIGSPEPYKVRVFGTLNSPGPYGTVLGCLLVLVLSGFTSRWRPLTVTVGFIGLGLSLVRSAWVGLVVALMSLVGAGRVRALGGFLMLAALPVAFLLTTTGPISTTINTRIQSSYSSGAKDQSFVDRLAFHARMIPIVGKSLTGAGLGAVGASTKLGSAQGALGPNGDFDSGLLAVLFTLGIGVGMVFVFVVGHGTLKAWRRGQRGGQFEVSCGAAMVGLFVQTVFGNVFVSASGVLFWLLLGFLARRPGDDPTGIT